MAESSPRHVEAEQVIHAVPQSERPELMQSSRDDFTSEDALYIFSDKLERALRRQKQEIVSELNLAQSLATDKKVPDFKFQSNKIQFEFNTDRENEIKKAVNLLENKRIEAAIDTLNSSVSHLNKRNKMVRIADKYGWDVVEEYQDDPITDDADDASKLRQAIFRVKKRNNNKKPYEKTPRASHGQEPRAFPEQFFRAHGSDFGPSFPGTGYGYYPYSQPFTQPQEGYKKATPTAYGGAAAKNVCFYCNKFGHWANKCPERGNNFTASSKSTDNKQ